VSLFYFFRPTDLPAHLDWPVVWQKPKKRKRRKVFALVKGGREAIAKEEEASPTAAKALAGLVAIAQRGKAQREEEEIILHLLMEEI